MKALQILFLFCTAVLYGQYAGWSSFYSKEVEVYPNPIRPNYTGLLTVRGLQSDCVVKITDIVGNAVFETTTTGGSIKWDLRSFSGERVRSGVYLIFVTTNDGLESAVEKVMIIN
jgi:hypothetical protein